jgi:Ca-activated chloride channel family protein
MPATVLGLVWLFSIVAVAGPAWERAEQSGSLDESVLFVVLDLSRSMLASDVQPSRYERAKQKIGLLIDRRTGSRTALIGFAGTAHIVIPPSGDSRAVSHQLASLHPHVMPVPGTDVGRALELADSMVTSTGSKGTIVLVTDGVDSRNVGKIAEFDTAEAVNLVVWAVGTSQGAPIPSGSDGRFVRDPDGQTVFAKLDRSALQRLSDESEASVINLTLDDGDVGRVEALVGQQLAAADDETDSVWIDRGYLLLIPIAALGLLWFRKGWTVQLIGFVLLPALGGCSLQQESQLNDWWFSADQQGRLLLERGDSTLAAERFDDAMWKGVIAYRTGNFETALASFQEIQTADGYFNLGTTHAAIADTTPAYQWREQVSRYRRAVNAYDVALSIEPTHGPARQNREIVASEIERILRQFASAGATDVGADDTVEHDENFGEGDDLTQEDGGEKQEEEQGAGEQRAGAASQEQGGLFDQAPTLSTEDASELITRLVNDDPSVFLKNKFAFQAARKNRPPEATSEPW